MIDARQGQEAALDPSGDQVRSLWAIESAGVAWSELAAQLEHFGYALTIHADVPAIAGAIAHAAPAAVLAVLDDLADPAWEAVQQSLQGREAPVPLLVFSPVESVTHRLMAVQRGGDSFFLLPVDLNALADRLEALLDRGQLEEEPARILIVEDSRLAAAHFSGLLRQVGMETVVVRDPLEVMRPLHEFAPDLILMDMYLPGCSGLDVARLIRQLDAFVSIPIVFLSSDTNLDRRQRAMRLGGDDFISKPVSPDHLISSVLARVQRSRTLRAQLLLDGLTGLLNRAATDQRLETEISRARRNGSPLSVAVLDIDHFKAVNDTYGHLTGDQVIKGLARLLKRRLRRSDVVGRYGGEEFVVILPETDGAEARHVMDQLRERFCHVVFETPLKAFSASFSCGVATSPPFDDHVELTAAADEALYGAKRGGRNRVVCHEAPV